MEKCVLLYKCDNTSNVVIKYIVHHLARYVNKNKEMRYKE